MIFVSFHGNHFYLPLLAEAMKANAAELVGTCHLLLPQCGKNREYHDKISVCQVIGNVRIWGERG